MYNITMYKCIWETMSTVFKYAVNGFGTSFYCKVTELEARGPVFYSFAFGGKDPFCFVAAMDPSKDYIPYID